MDKQIEVLNTNNVIISVLICPDNTTIIYCTKFNIVIYDTITLKIIKNINTDVNYQLLSITISSDGKKIIGGFACSIIIWDFKTFVKTKTIFLDYLLDGTIEISYNNKKIYYIGLLNEIIILNNDLENEYKAYKKLLHPSRLCSFALNSDSTKLVSGCSNGNLILWNLNSNETIYVIEGHFDWINSVAISRDNKKIITGSYDKYIKIYDMESGQEIKTLESREYISSIVISSDNKKFISGDGEGIIKIWNLENNTIIRKIDCSEMILRRISSLCLSQDNTIFVSHSNYELRIWDFIDGERGIYTKPAIRK